MGAIATNRLLEGRVALITGASRGIGKAIARTLGRMGAMLSLCARDTHKLQSARRELEAEGATVLDVPADISRPDDIAALVQATERTLGPIEILVNNAGIGHFAPIQESTDANWDATLDTN